MKKVIFVTLMSLLVVGIALTFAQEPTVDDVKKQLNALFPNFSVDSVSKSPISGIYEIVGKDGQIIYWSPEGYLIFGEIWTQTGKSVTGERRQEILAKKVNNLDLSQAVKIGNGKTKVITFTDPECPFCKKGYEFLSQRKDITEYVFFLPFKGEISKKKSAYVICAKDKDKAYKEVMFNKDVSVSQECLKTAEPVIEKHLSVAQSLGIGGTPTYFIKGQPVYGANIPLIENLLNQNKGE